eukprot:RCo045135
MDVPPGQPRRTLFLCGFPSDWTQRELSNLFACADGFECAVLCCDQHGSLTAFARFDTVANAEGVQWRLDKRIVDDTCSPPRWLECCFADGDLEGESMAEPYFDPTGERVKRRRMEQAPFPASQPVSFQPVMPFGRPLPGIHHGPTGPRGGFRGVAGFPVPAAAAT